MKVLQNSVTFSFLNKTTTIRFGLVINNNQCFLCSIPKIFSMYCVIKVSGEVKESIVLKNTALNKAICIIYYNNKKS